MTWNATFKTPWFGYSMLCVLCWAGWALFSKLGSREIPPESMQFLFTIGTLPIGIALLIGRRFKLEKSPKGIIYAIFTGVLAGTGGLALFAAYHTHGSTALITSATALYPVITVLLAVTILRETLRTAQVVGLAFAVVAFVIFSL
jgi:transporter family protein